jgi:predicted  nucleic acid-binding Zn-ribbon protein
MERGMSTSVITVNPVQVFDEIISFEEAEKEKEVQDSDLQANRLAGIFTSYIWTPGTNDSVNAKAANELCDQLRSKRNVYIYDSGKFSTGQSVLHFFKRFFTVAFRKYVDVSAYSDLIKPALQEKVQQQQEPPSQPREQPSRIQRAVNAIAGVVAGSEGQVAQLQRENAAQKTALGLADQEKIDLNKRVQALQAELEEETLRAQQAKALTTERDATIAEKEKEKKALDQRIVELEKTVASLEKQVSKKTASGVPQGGGSTDELSQAQAELSKLRKELADANKELGPLRESKERTDSEIPRLRENIKGLEELLKGKEIEHFQLQRDLAHSLLKNFLGQKKKFQERQECPKAVADQMIFVERSAKGVPQLEVCRGTVRTTYDPHNPPDFEELAVLAATEYRTVVWIREQK